MEKKKKEKKEEERDVYVECSRHRGLGGYVAFVGARRSDKAGINVVTAALGGV